MTMRASVNAAALETATGVSESRFGRSRKVFRLADAVLAVIGRRFQNKLAPEMAALARVEVRTAEYWLAGGGMGLDAFGNLIASEVGPDIFDAWIEAQPQNVRQRWETHLEKRAIRADLRRRQAEIDAAKRVHGL